ncbi:AAA family ATPase [Paenibacillus septentrionalis]|uniref:AAA family ATPase n=1 Tax=Paenibacillus septentrionalis TaxID=429342 RepID=A0ABW1V1Y3_9BACL
MKNNWKELLIGIAAAAAIYTLGYTVHIGAAVLAAVLLAAIFVMNRNGRGVKSLASLKKKKSVQIQQVSFDQVGGQDHVKQELQEALDFLVFREEIAKRGIRILKGILLTGPPGTGKTLLAKAAANYTDSVFIGASGSEFVEMYVGTGANRIRELFQKARSEAKSKGKKSAIIFIDEIDVIGGKRDGGQQREYDQTLNQLLTELDGIYHDTEVQILLIAATNRKDMLDDALLRPGRFDRHIEVALPDKQSRKHILELHSANKRLVPTINFDELAKDTYQFSGAQLEAVMNEAAIYAMRESADEIHQDHIQSAIDKVLLGEKINREASQEDKIRVARHELGHAIMAELTTPGSVAQVVLAPRGGALGFVRHTPLADKYLYTKTELEHKIMVTLGGAVAEELFYGERSTGSRGDFDQALNIVKTMVESGLTSQGIINGQMMTADRWSLISNEVLDECLAKTKEHLSQHFDIFEQALPILLEEEVINGDNFRNMMKNAQLNLINLQQNA